jgi:SSS family solute:Na+ symporter
MVLIGLLSSRRINDKEDFLLAGRRLGPIMMAGTLAATELGGGSSLGVIEKAYSDWGLSAMWYVIAMAIVFVIMAFLAPYFRNSLVKTVPEYFVRRYGKPSGAITSVIMILPLVGLTAIQFIVSATILSVMVNWNYNISVIIISLVVVAYSVMGGLWSVTLTDIVQMVLIVIGMAAGAIFVLNAVGGWSEIIANTPAEKISIIGGMGVPTIVALLVMYLSSFCFGQEAVKRYYAAKNAKTDIQGSLITAVIYLIYAIIPVIIGLSARVMVD